MVVNAADILSQAKAHAKGGATPSWAGKRVYVGQQAVSDWKPLESKPMDMGAQAMRLGLKF